MENNHLIQSSMPGKHIHKIQWRWTLQPIVTYLCAYKCNICNNNSQNERDYQFENDYKVEGFGGEHSKDWEK